MDLDRVDKLLRRVHPKLAGWLFRGAGRIAPVRRVLEAEYRRLLGEMAPTVKPYHAERETHTRLPERGIERDEILSRVEGYARLEDASWSAGLASGAVYHGDPEHIAFLNRVYALQSQSNPLHADLWPSTAAFEAEIVAMIASMLGHAESGSDVVGTVTSGGTESILLAMKAYRDRAGVRNPEIVVPETAHAAFDKAARLFGIRLVKTPVDHAFRADVAGAAAAIGKNTVALAGSAPSFPHGIVDPIPELAAIALERGIGFHTDACLGGFVLPWARRLGYPVVDFDFRVPGVTSMSVDTHKYGYAAKGTSVVLYRGRELRRKQYYTNSDWPGGLYFSPTLAGSRPGGLSAACWAAMLSLGESGYVEATRRILETAAVIRSGIDDIAGVRVLGDPLWVIALTSDHVDIYRVMDQMSRGGWSLNGLQRPPAIHIAVTLRHTQPGVAERFLADLAAAVDAVARLPADDPTSAPLYGVAASFPVRGVVEDLLERYIDMLYEP